MSNVCGTTTDTVVITTNATTGPTAANIITANTCLTSTSSLTLNASTVTVVRVLGLCYQVVLFPLQQLPLMPTTASFTTAGNL